MTTPGVLFVTRKFPPSVGGMETLSADVWFALRETRPGALLIAHGGSNAVLPLWVPYAVVRTALTVVRHRPAQVLTGDALMAAVLHPLLRLLRVPHATMVMGLDVTFPNPVYRALVLPPLRRTAAVIAISTATAEAAVAAGVPAERVSVVRLGVELPPEVTVADRQAAGAALRRRLGLGVDALVFVTVGRLVPRKGVAWFVGEVLPALPGVHHVVAGDGADRDRVLAAAVAAGVADRVHLLGRVDDATREQLLRGGDLFVQPNVAVAGDMEGFGLVVVEAAVRGTPVVAADLEGIADAAVPDRSAILLPPGSATAWNEALVGLLADRAALPALGARFASEARERYSRGAMAASLDGILDAVTAPPDGRRGRRHAAQAGSGIASDQVGRADRAPQEAYSTLQALMLDERSRRAKAAKILAVLHHHLGRDDLTGLTALDVGASGGIIAGVLAADGATTTGIDIDEPGIALAREQYGERVEFLVASGDDLPMADGSVDIVVYNHIYEHVVDPAAVMREITRVLAPGGVVYLGLGQRWQVIEPHYRLPFLSWLPRGLADRYLRASGRAEHYHERFATPRGLREMLRGYHVYDYTIPVVRFPAEFAGGDVVPGPARHLPAPAVRALLPLVPTYVWIAAKHAMPPGHVEPGGAPRHLDLTR